ncbi:protein adenylyltransferase SelO family protein [Synechococcus sp. M16CYN]|uniref:protein adenylyltransferase SelO family protein n=1 Tax=Synechococcus sp. M16CYN TaxID=3103139 RepID=UPI00324D78BC
MSPQSKNSLNHSITSFNEFLQCADYSLINYLNADPDSTQNGNDHSARQVFSGHFVPVKPTPLKDADYVIHSQRFFDEIGLSDSLVKDQDFIKMFSGDLSSADVKCPFGWATGYALSIYGTEYIRQCPFGTGNGYGDGRAISVFEGLLNGKRWEMQLKGSGPTPYCRGGDGRAVLRSSVREFLAQEFMYALGIPTTRSLTLFVSRSQMVMRPWYSEHSTSHEPDIVTENPVSITTRVASSFLRVGQLELFARRAYNRAHPRAMEELNMIVSHLIDREYKNSIDLTLSFTNQLVELSFLFQDRLTSLVANWLRVGFCQGNFNSDNCTVGGFTLDYGPFGFCELFDPNFQPWISGGRHFSFFNQPVAAEANFNMFWKSLRILLLDDADALQRFDQSRQQFKQTMRLKIQAVWTSKLGLVRYDHQLCQRLLQLLSYSRVDYTIFFRELSNLPRNLSGLKKSFYDSLPKTLENQWLSWLNDWYKVVTSKRNIYEISQQMKQTNPKYTWREWLVVPAYEQATQGDYKLIREIHNVLSHPYDEQSKTIENKYYLLKPESVFSIGGISHYSCSS